MDEMLKRAYLRRNWRIWNLDFEAALRGRNEGARGEGCIVNALHVVNDGCLGIMENFLENGISYFDPSLTHLRLSQLTQDKLPSSIEQILIKPAIVPSPDECPCCSGIGGYHAMLKHARRLQDKDPQVLLLQADSTLGAGDFTDAGDSTIGAGDPAVASGDVYFQEWLENIGAAAGELLDAILCEIDDTESLKACSLAASALRSPSQRILLSASTIKVENFVQIWKLFTESPHIEEYVHVRSCRLNGAWYECTQYSNFPLLSGIPPLLLDFLARQPLRELCLIKIDVTPTVLWRFVAVVPTLYLSAVSILEETDVIPAPVLPPAPLSSLFIDSPSLEQFLARPENTPRVANLQYLSLWNGSLAAGALIAAASQALEHIQFDCEEFSKSPSPPLVLPRLPALRSVQFCFPSPMTPVAVKTEPHLYTNRLSAPACDEPNAHRRRDQVLPSRHTPRLLAFIGSSSRIEKIWAPCRIFATLYGTECPTLIAQADLCLGRVGHPRPRSDSPPGIPAPAEPTTPK
ncbi:hypothetical protein K438DRAFT_1957760 [Mycena galopus ATCC 62051]|nr:hypothetical protein K438DRAFT_1957760 [Mycena galopus ATCC 62051]